MSKYASLQVTLRKSLSNGLTFTTAFTYARDSARGSGDLLQSGAPQDIYNRNAEWGPAMNDVKMRSVTTAMYELPLTKWMHTNGRVSNMALGGWSVSGVFTGQTGLPQNIYDLFATGNGTNDRPNACGCGVPTYLNNYQPAGLHQYLNAAAFINLPVSPLSNEQIAPGNLSYNAVRAPGLINVDFTLAKAFTITERFRLRLRADTFNTLNHTNLGTLVTSLGSANFGQLTSATARTMQLTARLTF
jgi:hypothetical protein